jgi:hypothetical protein
MFDFIKTINLSEELKTNEIYNLFKTDSSELNLQIISSLQKFQKTNDFLNYYTKQDCKNTFEIFNNISIISSTICQEKENNFNSETDKYLSEISKIIYLFTLIQKNNELLSNLLKNTKNYIKRFYLENKTKSNVKERIKNCINDLMSSSQVTSQRNYSRRSTKENTISPSNLFVHNLGKSRQFDINSNEDELLLFQCFTPKFEEDEDEIVEVNEEQSLNNINSQNKDEIKEESSKKDSKKSIETFGSSLSIRHMKFVYNDNESVRAVKKNKTIKMGVNFSDPQQFFKKKSISNKINDNSFSDDFDSDNQNNEESLEKTKILAKFLNIINNLFKEGKINSQKKLAIKQLIITNTESIIQKFPQYNNSNNYFNNNFKSKYIKKFLIEQAKNL